MRWHIVHIEDRVGTMLLQLYDMAAKVTFLRIAGVKRHRTVSKCEVRARKTKRTGTRAKNALEVANSLDGKLELKDRAAVSS